MTPRQHEARARALLDLAAPLIERAKSSDRETDERSDFLAAVAQVTEIARFEAIDHTKRVPAADVLAEFMRMCQAITARVGVEPMAEADVLARVAEIEDSAARGLARMDEALARMRRGPATCDDPTLPRGCSRVTGHARVQDSPPPTCRYSGKAWACRPAHGPTPGECRPKPGPAEGMTPAEAIEAIPVHMRETSDAKPLDPDERRRRSREASRRDRREDKRVEAVLARQAPPC